MELQLTNLHRAFDELQKKYGSPKLDSIYGAGCVRNPKVCFVFMNPTGKNVASAKTWKGLKAPWLGTKNVWKLFNAVGVLSDKTYADILSRRPGDWDYDFATRVYGEIAANGAYITNLGKCTQDDARPLPDNVFREYLDLLEQEIEAIKPEKIITFGGQVSSLFLGAPVKVSEMRKKSEIKIIGGVKFRVWPVYYPVGQGMRNLSLAAEDIRFALAAPTKLCYRDFTKEDFPKWDAVARSEFLEGDFCDSAYLLKIWDLLKGWILLGEDGDWTGCCFIDFRRHEYNVGGAHFLEAVVFPKYRGQGYAKYLMKIMFGHSKGYRKSCCIAPANAVSIRNAMKYGFKKIGPHKIWDAYVCDKDCYPPELENLELEYRKPRA